MYLKAQALALWESVGNVYSMLGCEIQSSDGYCFHRNIAIRRKIEARAQPLGLGDCSVCVWTSSMSFRVVHQAGVRLCSGPQEEGPWPSSELGLACEVKASTMGFQLERLGGESLEFQNMEQGKGSWEVELIKCLGPDHGN